MDKEEKDKKIRDYMIKFEKIYHRIPYYFELPDELQEDKI